jgi:hypothetical protein
LYNHSILAIDYHVDGLEPARLMTATGFGNKLVPPTCFMTEELLGGNYSFMDCNDSMKIGASFVRIHTKRDSKHRVISMRLHQDGIKTPGKG